MTSKTPAPEIKYVSLRHGTSWWRRVAIRATSPLGSIMFSVLHSKFTEHDRDADEDDYSIVKCRNSDGTPIEIEISEDEHRHAARILAGKYWTRTNTLT